ncbi:MAG TPA: type I pantothenate kinase [Propionibacteriaceae bacterium]|nr:type I pantothenate kinase [Propionibacteriaceae bacterium]HPZ49874.1 type I pantothenate kinase [Propionibacteriaceae bacterium]HQE31686.1 type I pantothenate kinase [Propionibacteriaceae bacterium]
MAADDDLYDAVQADDAAPEDDPYGPYVTTSREVWADLAQTLQLPLSEETLDRIRATGDPIDIDQVRQVYLPMTELVNLFIEHKGMLYGETNKFLGLSERKTPFVIGVAGSVAVGKSTTSRLLRELLRAEGATVDLVTTDGFLFPNAELESRGLMTRKGFPESYDRRRLLRFVMDVKSGVPEVKAPVYNHLVYDILEGEHITVRQPDILILEGLNVLQPARRRTDGTMALAVSDFFDFSVYVDADTEMVRQWYVERFMHLRDSAFRDPKSFFVQFSKLSDDEAIAMARSVWDAVNGPNLEANIRPTRGRATVVLRKGDNHDIEWIRIRKV